MGRPLADEPEGQRFQLRGELGSGGVGTIYRVFDSARGEEVALKTLRSRSGRDIYRFKREFRSLAELEHPNLVRLHELFAVADEWMFTMELVDGVPFADRAALPQLVDGLIALHAVGKIHRDVKPSNVLVEPGGRVVILDFGLVADLGQMVADHTHEQSAVGTPAYMSPEQAADLPLTTASDWYSVGTLLYRVITGRRPFEGNTAQILYDKQLRDPPDLRALVPPDPLADLTMRMLARDPAARPTGEEILAELGLAPSAATLQIMARAERRQASERTGELAALRDAYVASRDHHVVVLIVGPRGSGKSTLVDTFLDEMRAGGALVFHTFDSGREALPLPSIDRLVDEYAAWLSSRPPEEQAELLPPRMSAAQRVFPTLRRIPAVALPAMPGSLPSDPDALVRQAFLEMAEATYRVAERYPLVIAVDDVQRGTRLTLDLITDLFAREGAPPYLDIYTHETKGPVAPVIEALRRLPGDVRIVEL